LLLLPRTHLLLLEEAPLLLLPGADLLRDQGRGFRLDPTGKLLLGRLVVGKKSTGRPREAARVFGEAAARHALVIICIQKMGVEWFGFSKTFGLEPTGSVLFWTGVRLGKIST
jgi:hypothetical protein